MELDDERNGVVSDEYMLAQTIAAKDNVTDCPRWEKTTFKILKS